MGWPKVEKEEEKTPLSKRGQIRMRMGWARDGGLAYLCTLSKVNPQPSTPPSLQKRHSTQPFFIPLLLPSFWKYPRNKDDVVQKGGVELRLVPQRARRRKREGGGERQRRAVGVGGSVRERSTDRSSSVVTLFSRKSEMTDLRCRRPRVRPSSKR